MKLKLIVAALGLAASAASQASITPTTTIGGSSLVLSVWDDSNPQSTSFMLNLGTTLTQFSTTGSLTSSTLATLLSTDTTWTSFLASGVNTADLDWSVIASGSIVPNAATKAYSIFGTVTAGQESVAANSVVDNIAAANTTVNSYLQAQNGANELVSTFGTSANFLTNNTQIFGDATQGWSNGNAVGTTANVYQASAYHSGNYAGAPAVVTEFGTLTFTQSGSSYVLSYNVAAVPEAPGYGLALAGFAAIGLIALRRKKA